MRKIFTLCFLLALLCVKGWGQTTQTFSYTGSNQTFTVPAGVTSISVKMWGAGGGGSAGGPSSGGSGALVKGTISVTTGQTLVFVVGGGGTNGSSAAGGFGGGGASGLAGDGGSGGGYSGIFITSTTQANALAIAGGGAGGGYYDATTYGGAGGALVGSAGGTLATGYTGGSGGTTSAGGAGALFNGNSSARSNAGSALTGGSAGTGYTYGGGGGGGGYYGGGSGYSSNASATYSSGGGGGSSFLGSMTATTNTVGTTNNTATGNQAPGSAESGYIAGIGNGGSGSTTTGGNGLIIISYTVPAPTITSFTPTSGCATTGTLVITGTNFTGTTAVKIGGTAVASFVVNSATQITATVGSGTTGTIAITTPGGTATSTTSFSVNLPPNTLSYSSNTASYCVGTAITANTPSNGGSAPTSYSVSPALPTGLSINGTTGVISGTPTTISAAANYTVTASNSCGSTTKAVNIAVTTAPTAVNYTTNTNTYCTGIAIAANNPTVTGGAATSYSVSPSLPTGLALNATTGVISGTPTAQTATSTYTVTAINSCGSVPVTLTITVNTSVSALNYITTSAVYCQNAAITPNTVSSITGSGTISYSATLPAGLSIDPNTGAISGTPTTLSSAANYTVTATNGCSSTTKAVNITVTTAPVTVSYSVNPAVYCPGTAITANTPTTNSGGAPTSYAVSPSLPAGLSISSTTGVISGTPTTATLAATYTVTASNACGSTTVGVNITINPPAPSALTYSANTATYCIGTAITNNTPSNGGGVATSYSVNPALPTGLSINGTTGVISGTPTTATAAANYTVIASNSCGSTTRAVNITVTTAPVTVSYSFNPAVYCQNVAITNNAPTTNSGGAPTSYSVSPALPAGLSINGTTGVISGTPTTAIAAASYTVTASNSCGSTTVGVSIAITAAVNITTQPASQTGCVGSPVTFSVVASNATTYQWRKGTANISGATSSSYTIASVAAGDAGGYNVVVGGNSPCGSATSSSATLTVNPAFTGVAASATPSIICLGGSSQLLATSSTVQSYGYTSISSPAPTTGTPVQIAKNSFSSLDDGFVTVPMPFAFRLYGTSYSQVSVSINGYAMFNAGANNYNGNPIPTTDFTNPVIALCYSDLELIAGTGQGEIDTFTVGTAPNRKFIIKYNNVGFYKTSTTVSGSVTGQIELNESDNDFDLYLNSVSNGTASKTKAVGVQFSSTQGIGVTGRNGTNWQLGAVEGYHFSDVTYTWSPSTALSATNIANPVATPTATTQYTVTGTNSSGCTSTSSITITVNPNTTIALTSAAGTDAQELCANSPLTPITYQIGGSGTNASIPGGVLPAGVTGSYNSTTKVYTISGTPSSTVSGSFPYTVTATGPCTTVTINGIIKVDALPAMVNFTASGAQYYCTDADGNNGDGFNVVIDASQVGVNYELQLNGSTITTQPGTGSSIDFGFQLTSGTYTVKGTNATTGCNRTVTNQSIILSVRQRPAHFAVTVNSAVASSVSVCSGNSFVIGLSGSESGIIYRLTRNGSAIGTPVNGTGSAISFPAQTVAGSYGVYANSTCGLETMDGQVAATVNPLPIAYTVTGTTTQCSGDGLTYPVGLSNSQTGVTYTLVKGGVPTSTTTAGTGSAISFGNQPAGTYTVMASNNTTGCTNTMTGNAVITVNPTPSVSITAGAAVCAPTGVSVTFTGTPGSIITYDISGAATQTGLQITLPAGAGTTSNSVTTSGNAGTYTYTITDVVLGTCHGGGGSTSATVNPLPTITLTSAAGTNNQSVCGYNPIIPITYSFGGGATGIGTITISPANAGISATVDNVNKTVTISGTPTTLGGYTYSFGTTGGSCGNTSTSGSITVTPYSWTGNISSNWSDANNWCGGVPVAGADVTISASATNSPVLPSGTTTVGNLVISSGKTVTIYANNTLVVNGNVSGTGSFIGSATSNLVVNNTSTLHFTTGANTLKNLTISGGTVTLGDALNITGGANYGIVTVSGNGQLATGNVLTLKSDANGTAAIGIHTGSVHVLDYITGNVTVERYSDGGDAVNGRRAWRLMTSPITGQNIRDAWQEGGATNTDFGALITGEGLDAATAAAQGYDYIDGSANHTSIKHYTGGAWVPISSDGNTDGTKIPVRNEQAYLVFVRGKRTIQASGSSPANLRATGSLFQGDQTTTIGAGTFTVVGNPYASSIDFGSIYLNNQSVIQDQFYLWNSKYSTFGAYVLLTHDGTNGYKATPAPIANVPVQDDNAFRYIPSGSGFFAFRNGGGTLTIREQDKAPGNTPPVSPFKVVPNATNVREIVVNLNQKNSDNSSTLADGFRAKFSPDYEGNEEDNSAVKASNINENLGLIRNGISHIIEAHDEVKKTDTLQLKLWNVSYRSYELQMKGNNFTSAPGIKAWLEDSYLNSKQAVDLTGGITTVGFVVNQDSGSWKSTRFRIVFENTSTALPVAITKVTAQPKNGGVDVSWNVSNETNIKGYTVEKSTDGRTFTTAVAQQSAKNNPQEALTSYSGYDPIPKVGDNYYRIRIEGNNGKVSYSEIVKVTIGASGTGIQITLYPNPVREGKANLILTNLKEGTYLVSVFSGSGQTVYQKKVTITLAGTTQSEQLLLGNSIAQGSYQIRVADSKGVILFTDKLIVGR